MTISNAILVSTYDASGYLTRQTEGSSEFLYTYQNGNLASEVIKRNGVVSTTITYEYYTDKNSSALPLISFYGYDAGVQFGTKNKNLLKKSTVNGSVVNYMYEFNSDGYVSKTTASGSGTSTSTETYTYMCK
ncbi:MAG: hypothetical protein RI894_928 [Bacteroidota bacterium]|jgi:hypothetical protein